MKTRPYRIITVMAAVLLFSCTFTPQEEQQQQSALSPVETVRLLAEENRQYESSSSRSTPAHAPEIKEILDRGYIIFGMTAADQKPFFYIDAETGEFIGLDVEIAYAIANRLGVKAVFNRNAASFNDVVQEVINKRADIALSKLSLTMTRAEMVRFTVPYITFRQALLINRLEYAKIGTEERLPGFIRNYRGALGVIANSSYQTYAVTNFPNADLKPFDTWDQAVDALFDGNLLAVYRDEGEILIVNSTRKDASILMKPVIISDKRDPIAMAVSADAPLLQEWLNVFLEDYLTQNRNELTPIRLIERHFGSGS